MSNTPSDEEMNSVLCHHWPVFPMQAVLVQMWLRDAMRAALAKWGTPQPVLREPLTRAQALEIVNQKTDVMMAIRLTEAAHGITGGRHGTDT